MITRQLTFVAGMLTGSSILAAGLLLGGAHRSLAAPQADVTDVLRARKLEIVDEIGTVVVALSSQKEGGAMNIANRFGRSLVKAEAAAEGGVMSLNFPAGEHAAFVASADKHGGRTTWLNVDGNLLADIHREVDACVLSLADESGASGFAVRSASGKGTEVALHNDAGSVSTRMFSDVTGGGVLETYRANGSPLVILSSTVGGHGQIRTMAGLGKPLVTLTATANHEGQLYLSDDEGRSLAAIATRPGSEGTSGGPTLRIFNKHGEPVVTLESDENDAGVLGTWRRDGSGRTIRP